MKRLIMLSCSILFAAFVHAQTSNSITINNNRNCDVYVILKGDIMSNPCGNNYVSSAFVVPGSTTGISYTVSTAPGGGLKFGTTLIPSNGIFTQIEVFNKVPPNGRCTPTSIFLGNSSCSWPTSGTISILDNTCTAACDDAITWNTGVIVNIN